MGRNMFLANITVYAKEGGKPPGSSWKILSPENVIKNIRTYDSKSRILTSAADSVFQTIFVVAISFSFPVESL